jgi:hypothetical protein
MEQYRVLLAEYQTKLEEFKQDKRFKYACSTLFGWHENFRNYFIHVLLEQDKPSKYLFGRLMTHLGYHHHAEEEGIFVVMRKRFNVNIDQLQEDHDLIFSTEEQVRQAFEANEKNPSDENQENVRDRVHTLMRLILCHLMREEMTVMPYLLPMRDYFMYHEN